MRPLLPRLLLIVMVLAALTACSQAAPGPTTPPSQATAANVNAGPTAALEASTTTPPTATAEPTATTAPTATATPAPTSTPDPAANAPKGQAALDLLLEAAKAQLAQPAFRATLTGKDSNGKDTAVALEYVKPDSFHLITPDQEIIIVKDGTFIKQGKAGWQKSPVNMQSLIAGILSEQGIERLVKDLKYEDIKLDGADVVGGKPMWVYEYKSTVDVGGTKAATQSKTWIGIADKLPYRVQVETNTGGGATTTMTGTYEYDPAIKIEAPKTNG